jgi:hypothetical protein
MKFPKRNVSSVTQACARSPSKPSKFDSASGIVTVANLTQFFHIVRKGCPQCASGFIDVDVSQFGVCLKAKLLCSKKHQVSWNSSDGMHILFSIFD